MENDIYHQLTGYFQNCRGIVMAFLFGSQAKGRARPDSDADVAVYFAPGYTREDIYRLWNELEDMLGLQVDLVVLNEANPSLAWAALKGKRLLVRDERFYIQYLLDISREAEDFQDFILDWHRWRLRVKGAV